MMPETGLKIMSEVIVTLATVAFAVTGVLAVRADRDIDLIGALVLGLITAIGGGTVRDLILNVPVFWKENLWYIWIAIIASTAAFYGRKFSTTRTRNIYSLMLYIDALGVSLFSIQAVAKVWNLDFGLPLAPVLLGVVTAIGGGLIRDVLAGQTTLLMRPELYATPVLLGCIAYVLVLSYLPDHRGPGAVACILGTFVIRAAAIHWDLGMPAFARLARNNEGQ